MTQTPDPLPRIREDADALEQSTVSTWNLLRHMLHLPAAETLATENQQQIANRLATFVSESRGGLANIGVIEANLTTFQAERLADVTGITAPLNGIHRAPAGGRADPNINVAVAQSWLETIYANFTAVDMDHLFRRLPASIMPIGTNNRWQPANIALGGGAPVTLSIDLNHPIWRTGDVDAISHLLVGRTPAQAGIRTTYAAALTQADVGLIFASSCNVVDPLLSLGQVQLDNQPVAGERTIIDVGQLIQRDREIAGLLAGNMTTEFQGARNALFEECTRRVQMNTGQPIAGAIPVAQIGDVVDALFEQQSRNPLAAFGQSVSTLRNAIERRAPIDRLMHGDASNREVLLALSMIQRDPTTAAVLEDHHTETTGLVNRRNIADVLARLLTRPAITLPTQIPANSTQQRVTHDLAQLAPAPTSPINILENAESAWLAAEQAYNANRTIDEGTLRIWQSEVENRDRIQTSNDRQLDSYNNYLSRHAEAAARLPNGSPIPIPNAPPALPPVPVVGPRPPATAVSPVFAPVTIPGPLPATIRSIEELRTRVTELRTLRRALEDVSIKFEETERILVDLRALLIRVPITAANIATLFPRLEAIMPGGVVDPNRLNATMDWAAVIEEIKANMPEGLQSVAEYQTQIDAAGEPGHDETSDSEACRAVIERGLQNQGLRGEQVENTVSYMLNSTQQSSASEQDMAMYAQRAFPDGPDNDEAFQEWASAVAPARPRNLHRDYVRRISTAIGFDLDEAATTPFLFAQTQPLDGLVDAYFRVKHLTELPLSDPHRLPPNPRIRQFLRQLFQHILRRGVKSLDLSMGGRDDFNAMRAKGLELNVENLPSSTIDERMQYVVSFLRQSDAYMADEYNKHNLDRIVNRAYQPIQQYTDRRNANAASRSRILNGMSPIVTLPLGIMSWAGRGVLNTAGKIGKVYKENPTAAVLGGVVGFLAMPGFGVPIGILAGPALYHYYQKISGGANTNNSGN